VRRGQANRLLIPAGAKENPTNRDPHLIRLVTKAWAARRAVECSNDHPDMIADTMKVDRSYFARLVHIGYLAPDILIAILQGRQPPALSRKVLARLPSLPVNWQDQRRLLSFV
jgi:hypothetical protein